MRKFLYIAPLLLALTACKDQQTEPAPEMISMANPASVYCEDQGGTLEIRDAELGQVGYCHLPDGRIVEEWELFRADNPVVAE